MAAALFACRRPLGATLAGRTTPAPWRTARVGRLEAAVAAVVIIGAMAMAADNLLLPARRDETITIVNYASRSFWHAWSTYSIPNNHVLHTLLVWVAHRLAGWDLVALRMPAFLAGCLVLPATWWFARREHGWPAAAFATALLGTSPLFVEYATNARGYTLMLLCFVAALACGSRVARRPEAVRWWAGYAVALGLGFFTVPLMAFPAAVVVSWMLLLRWQGSGMRALPRFALKTLAWTAGGGGLAALLYAPVLLGPWAGVLLGGDGGWLMQSLPWHAEGRWSAWSPRFVARLAAGTWLNWHAATPPVAQIALLAATAAGVAAPRGAQGGMRQPLAAAAIVGTAVVLLAKPVLLEPRMTLFLLLALMVVAGAGAAVLWEAVLDRAALGGRARQAARAAAVLAVFLGLAWPATRRATTEHFARETGWLIVAALTPRHLQPGDCVASQPALAGLVAPELLDMGYGLSPLRTDSILLDGSPVHVRRIDAAFFRTGKLEGEPRARRHVWFLADDMAARWARGEGGGDSAPDLAVEEVERRLLAGGWNYSEPRVVPQAKILLFEGEDSSGGGLCPGIESR